MNARLLSCLFLVCLLAPAWAWDTSDSKAGANSWLSVYDSMGVTEKSLGPLSWEEYNRSRQDPKRRATKGAAWGNNEHARLSTLALDELGLAESIGAAGKPWEVIDLNASLIRPEDLNPGKLGTYFAEPQATPLEERLIPQVPHFSGLPDLSYTLYDWINKHAFCTPGIQEQGLLSLPQLCHDFMGWMGALNSSHFGTQAALWYERLHRTALKLGDRAKLMREDLTAVDQATLKAWQEFVREAEREALIMEAYGQHFLQDRWATGHMWERWNASDYQQLALQDWVSNIEPAIAAGLLHGSESVTLMVAEALGSKHGTPDPMCSPYLNPLENRHLSKAVGESLGGVTGRLINAAIKMRGTKLWDSGDSLPMATWRHESNKGDRDIYGINLPPADTSPTLGVGDRRLQDMLDGAFGKEYGHPDRPLQVGIQKRQMFNCMKAGWVEVIHAFGQNGDGYGIDKLKPKGKIQGFRDHDLLRQGCLDQWATNRAMAMGWTDIITTLGQFARLAVGFSEDAPGVADLREQLDLSRGLKLDRMSWLRVSWNIWSNTLLGLDDTNLARGDIGDFDKVKSGNHFGLPFYIEPEDLTSLPSERDSKGRDLLSFAGFFNRAHTDWWCDQGWNRLESWRGSDNRRKQAACSYIADRYYAGTRKSYRGRQREVHKLRHTDLTVQPICSLYGNPVPERVANAPITLPPGYVEKPGQRGEWDLSYHSIDNWCDRIPVLYLHPEQKLGDEDVVALVRRLDELIELKGDDLGDKPGVLKLDGRPVRDGTIKLWQDNQIQLKLDPEINWEERDYVVEIVRASDQESTVGRFWLRIKPAPPRIRNLRLMSGEQRNYDYRQAISRRIPPGVVQLTLTFDQPMDRDTPAGLRIPAVQLEIAGQWATDRQWRGWFEAPPGKAFDAFIGAHDVEISARSGLGKWLDGDPTKPGHQPNTQHRFRFGRPPPAPPTYDLSGCWTDGYGDTLQIRQHGLALQGELTTGALARTPIELELAGRYEPPLVTLSHRYTRQTLEALKPGLDQNAYQALLAADANWTLRFEPFGGMTYGGVAGASSLGGGRKFSDYFVKPRQSLDGEMAWRAVREEVQPTIGRLLRQDGYLYDYTDLRVTQDDFTTPLTEMTADQPFWVSARGRDGCPFARERLHIQVHPEGDASRHMNLTLIETGWASNEFRSPSEGHQLGFELNPDEEVRLKFWSSENAELEPVWIALSAERSAFEEHTFEALPKSVAPAPPRDIGIDYHLGGMREGMATSERQLTELRQRARALHAEADATLQPDQAASRRFEAESIERQIRAIEQRLGNMEHWFDAAEHQPAESPAIDSAQAVARLQDTIADMRRSLAAAERVAATETNPVLKAEAEREVRNLAAILARLEEMEEAPPPTMAAIAPAVTSKKANAARNRMYLDQLKSQIDQMTRNAEHFEKLAAMAKQQGDKEKAAGYREMAGRNRQGLVTYLQGSDQIFDMWHMDAPAWVAEELDRARRELAAFEKGQE